MFSVKAPGHIMQRRVLADTGKAIDAFVSGGLEELGDRLGPILWQLPPTKAFERADLAAFLEQLPRSVAGRPLRHVLEVRHESFRDPDYVALARTFRVPTVFTDSPEYPSFADPTGDFVYARLMRSAAGVATGYPGKALDAWAKRAQQWASGADPADLPRVAAAESTKGKARDVYIYFISAAKERNPAAAMALLDRLKKK